MPENVNYTNSELADKARRILSQITVKYIWYQQHKNDTALPLSLIIQKECKELVTLQLNDSKLSELGFKYAAKY